eukprot:SAG31_NODE_36388_length_314_cov_0.488372_1_plen_91_part_10
MLTVDPARRINTQDIQRHPWFLGIAPAAMSAGAGAVSGLTEQVTGRVGRFEVAVPTSTAADTSSVQHIVQPQERSISTELYESLYHNPDLS